MVALQCVGAMQNGAAIPARASPVKGGGGVGGGGGGGKSSSSPAAGTGRGAGSSGKQTLERITGDEKKVERLRRWLQTWGHDECNLRLERWPRGSDALGYGMVAGKGGIQQSDVLVRVPKEAMMTEETAAKCPFVGPLADAARLTPWQTMCLHLLCERARGEKSPWFPYIDLLPSELQMTGSHPMLWPQRTRKEWLEGSSMLDTTERRLQLCREDHEAMLAAGASKLVPAGPGSGGFVTELAVRWAAVILLSRSFSLEISQTQSDSGPSLALVPWADMLNHSSSAGKESCLIYDSHYGSAALRAHQSYKEQEQVYDSYGPNLSPSQLLLDYGFVDDQNQNYAVSLPGRILGPVKGKQNAILLEAVGLPFDEAIFALTPSGVDESVLAWTRAAVATSVELAEAGWKGDTPESSSKWQHHSAAIAMASFSQPISRKNESEVLRRILWAAEDMLRQYPTKLEEDVAALTPNDSDTAKVVPLPWARKQAVRALISEKSALVGAHKVLWEVLAKLRAGTPLQSLYHWRFE